MKKPHCIVVDDEGNKLGVLLKIEDLSDKIDEEYSQRLYDRAIEAGEPTIPLEEYLKNRKPLAKERNVALAVYDLYKSLQDDVQEDIRKLISSDQEGTDDLSRMSNQSFSDIWKHRKTNIGTSFLRIA